MTNMPGFDEACELGAPASVAGNDRTPSEPDSDILGHLPFGKPPVLR